MTAPASTAHAGRRSAFIALAAVLAAATVFAPVRIIYKHNQKHTVPPQAVSIHNFSFDPAILTVKEGTVITFTNNDGAAHTVTSDDGTFDLGRVQGGQTMTWTATKSVTYHCDYHGSMHGSIVVEG